MAAVGFEPVRTNWLLEYKLIITSPLISNNTDMQTNVQQRLFIDKFPKYMHQN